MKNIWVLLGAVLLIGCAQSGFEGAATPEGSLKSMSAIGADQMVPPPYGFPSGEWRVTHIYRRNVCNAPKGIDCPSWHSAEQKIDGDLRLYLQPNGGFHLSALCTDRYGSAIFRRDNKDLRVKFVELPPDRPYGGIPTCLADPSPSVKQAIAAFFTMNQWLEQGLRTESQSATTALTDGAGTYILLETVHKKVPVAESYQLSAIEIAGPGCPAPKICLDRPYAAKIIKLNRAVRLDIDSKRNFSLTSLCHTVRGRMPIDGAFSQGVKGWLIKVIVQAESTVCVAVPPTGTNYSGDADNEMAIKIFKHALLEQVSATGDRNRRFVDENGNAVIASPIN